MSNLFDYLTWRNDLTFSKVPCCAVDTLICSCLSYLRLQPVFAKQDMLYVKRASEIIRAINPEEIHFRVKEDLQLLHKMAEGQPIWECNTMRICRPSGSLYGKTVFCPHLSAGG